MRPDVLWYGSTFRARVARTALWPAEVAYRSVVGIRNALYDAGWMRSGTAALPAVAVGNVTVGGTGKTPVAAWLAGQLVARGVAPAIVLRGYGGDEVLVHQVLNPGIQVVADPVRERAIAVAQGGGARVVILDDAFQYRRLLPASSIVLVEAETFAGTKRCLPAGPLREPWSALSRATGVLITAKTAVPEEVDRVGLAVARMGVSNIAVARIVPEGVSAPGGIEWVEDGARPVSGMEALRQLAVLAVSGIGNSHLFEEQLRPLVRGLDAVAFPDHHRYTAGDAAQLSQRGQSADAVVCTLKDAVKLAPLWPRNGPRLLYVSQRVEVEGGAWLDGILDRLSAST